MCDLQDGRGLEVGLFVETGSLNLGSLRKMLRCGTCQLENPEASDGGESLKEWKICRLGELQMFHQAFSAVRFTSFTLFWRELRLHELMLNIETNLKYLCHPAE